MDKYKFEFYYFIFNIKRLSNLVVLFMMVKNVLYIDNVLKKKEISLFIGMYKGKINFKFRIKNYIVFLFKFCNIKFSLYVCKVNIL